MFSILVFWCLLLILTVCHWCEHEVVLYCPKSSALWCHIFSHDWQLKTLQAASSPFKTVCGPWLAFWERFPPCCPLLAGGIFFSLFTFKYNAKNVLYWVSMQIFESNRLYAWDYLQEGPITVRRMASFVFIATMGWNTRYLHNLHCLICLGSCVERLFEICLICMDDWRWRYNCSWRVFWSQRYWSL